MTLTHEAAHTPLRHRRGTSPPASRDPRHRLPRTPARAARQATEPVSDPWSAPTPFRTARRDSETRYEPRRTPAPSRDPRRAPGHRSQPHSPRREPRVDIYKPRLNIHLDQMFYLHRSYFKGTQEQLDELRRDADARAAARARAEYADFRARLHESVRRQTFEAHRPVFRRLKPVLHVGFVPMLWTITTCNCGDRWPCNSVKQYFRRRLGWNIDIDEHIDAAEQALPKPATRWSRLKRRFTRRGPSSVSRSNGSSPAAPT